MSIDLEPQEPRRPSRWAAAVDGVLRRARRHKLVTAVVGVAVVAGVLAATLPSDDDRLAARTESDAALDDTAWDPDADDKVFVDRSTTSIEAVTTTTTGAVTRPDGTSSAPTTVAPTTSSSPATTTTTLAPLTSLRGRVVFFDDLALWSVRLDGSDRRLLLAPSGVIDDCTGGSEMFPRYPDVSDDGLWVAYVLDSCDDGFTAEIHVMRFDGKLDRRLPPMCNWNCQGVTFSDDAQTVMVAGDGDLWLAPVDGSTPELVDLEVGVSDASWSGSGRHAVVDGARSSSEHGMYLVDLETGAAELLVQFILSPAMSPDGGRIAYHTYTSTTSGLAIYDLTTRTSEVVYDGTALFPAWSADGETVLFVGSYNENDVRALRLDTGTVTTVGEGTHPTM